MFGPKYPDNNPAVKILEFAYQKATDGKTFTAAEVAEDTGLDEAQFKQLSGPICKQSGNVYSISQEALFRYLNYRALKSADKHARNALIAAGVAVLISIGMTVYSASGPVPVKAPAPLEVMLTDGQVALFKPATTIQLDTNQVKLLQPLNTIKLDAEQIKLLKSIDTVKIDPEQLVLLKPINTVTLDTQQVIKIDADPTSGIRADLADLKELLSHREDDAPAVPLPKTSN